MQGEWLVGLSALLAAVAAFSAVPCGVMMARRDDDRWLIGLLVPLSLSLACGMLAVAVQVFSR